MLTRSELQKQGPVGFNLGQREKDYLQSWILYFISHNGIKAVFKGGTCLQKAFNLPRYSEDLDFTVLGDINLTGLKELLESAGFNKVQLKEKQGKISEQYKIRTAGPLYANVPASEVSVIVEFSKRELLIKKPIPILITPPYTDLLAYQITCMDLEEIAAEKVRAIYTRNVSRDLYDLYFLTHRQNAFPNIALVNKKLELCKKEFRKNTFKEEVKKLEENWKKEIKILSAQPLEFKMVAKYVENML
ncbi:MAG: nucleotidyl transferase AbiEii/AbiGii toxin family protein [Candidatus Micrarchaeota archaeon]